MTTKIVLENIQNLVNCGTHVVQALRQSLGYSIEELAVVCGLTSDEITLLENSEVVEPQKLARISSAVGFRPELLDQMVIKAS